MTGPVEWRNPNRERAPWLQELAGPAQFEPTPEQSAKSWTAPAVIPGTKLADRSAASCQGGSEHVGK
ncbi:hypothetical protein [Xylanibacillus composti]|uniref:hypothetical protein n=1 Tax=Xylanibacillus composti TaxID=1572762 RepID=UPI001BCF5E7A|nr:hypothetical protein [Xylanibacillus composti]